MKKNLLWMLAAILFCGITVTMLTSCGDDDPIPTSNEGDNNDGDGDGDGDGEGEGEGEKTIVKAGVYDISIAYIIHRSITEIFDVELTTTDPNGNENTYSFKTPQEPSDAFVGNEAEIYRASSYETFKMVDPLFTLDYCNDVIVRRINFRDVPVDKSVKFITVFNKKPDVQLTPHKYAFIRPSVVFTQTPKDNNKATVIQDGSVRASAIGANSFERWVNSLDGQREKGGTFKLVAGATYISSIDDEE